MGQLVILDTGKGFYDEAGLVRRLSGRGQSIQPVVRDALVEEDWPKSLHPYPLSDNYFLVAGWLEERADWAIYLADVFDNLVLVHREPDTRSSNPHLWPHAQVRLFSSTASTRTAKTPPHVRSCVTGCDASLDALAWRVVPSVEANHTSGLT